MKPLLRKIGVGMLAAVLVVSFAGAFDLAWAQKGKEPSSSANGQSSQSPPITSFNQLSSQGNKGDKDDKDKCDKDDNDDSRKVCASPPCKKKCKDNKDK